MLFFHTFYTIKNFIQQVAKCFCFFSRQVFSKRFLHESLGLSRSYKRNFSSSSNNDLFRKMVIFGCNIRYNVFLFLKTTQNTVDCRMRDIKKYFELFLSSRSIWLCINKKEDSIRNHSNFAL